MNIMRRKITITISLVLAGLFLYSNIALAYWIWTPGSKKFINPKYAVKDSPKEQYDWAMSFYAVKDYQRAAAEFEKLVKNYEYSEYASRSQYYVGLCYEDMAKHYIAFQNYQKAIDNFPHIANIDEVIEREFNIGNIYLEKDSPRLMGTDIITSLDRAIEIYSKVVSNAPYGKFADLAQFRMAEAFKRGERYDEAMQAFQKLVDDYPDSELFARAKYEVAYCAYKASLKPDYAVESTDKAIRAFEEFQSSNVDEKLSQEAEGTIQRLKDKAAEKSFLTAKFYESQKHYSSAIVYYQDVINRFPESFLANEAGFKVEELRAKISR